MFFYNTPVFRRNNRMTMLKFNSMPKFVKLWQYQDDKWEMERSITNHHLFFIKRALDPNLITHLHYCFNRIIGSLNRCFVGMVRGNGDLRQPICK